MSDSTGCTECGGALSEGGHCLGHVTDAELDRLAGRIRRGEPLDARGATVPAERIDQLLERVGSRLAAVDFTDARIEGDAQFNGVRFEGAAHFIGTVFPTADFRNAEFAAGAGFGRARFEEFVWFDGAEFEQGAHFSHASFPVLASFLHARFGGDVVFHGTEFASGPSCREAEFLGEAGFSTARFGGASSFGAARFAGPANFVGTEFGGDGHFLDARFEGTCAFAKARFAGDAVFMQATFAQRATFADAEFGVSPDFARARFDHDAVFTGAAFARAVDLGPLTVAGTLSISRATFADDVTLDVEAGRLDGTGASFSGRADLNVRRAEVVLDHASFEHRSLLAGGDPRPRVSSMRRASVANLALANLDLGACRFAGAHGLDELRIEPDCEFAEPPPTRRYTRRRTIAEEHEWRGWAEPVAPAQALEPARIASLYRLLRKALEDHKDEPGAADFYYGEMDMRRHQPRDRGEHAVLTLYWLVSGYGLRATRALACLAFTIVAAALLLDWFGFRPDEGFGRSLLFAIESSVSLLRAPETELTAAGEIVQIVLRLAGPLFFGLALLALRGRVKR